MMKKRLLPFAVISILFSTHAQAQSSNTDQFSIENIRTQAAAEERVADDAIKVEAQKGTGFDICKIQVLKLQKKYAHWFQDRYNDFIEGERQIDNALAGFKVKLVALKNEVITANPVQGQNAAVSLSYEKLIAYFTNYNDRIKSCDKNKLSILKESQEDPTLNPVGVAHSQVIAAIQKMTDNLNASLKESNSTYKVGFAEAACGYDLELTATVTLQSGKRDLKISLLTGAGSNLSPDRKSKWDVVYGNQDRIEGYSVHGLIRYLEMYYETVNVACAMKNWSSTMWEEEVSTAAVPYFSYADADRELTRLSKVNTSGIDKKSFIHSENQKTFSFPVDGRDCRTIIREFNTGYRTEDIDWLCGYSSNSRVLDLVNSPYYRGCVREKIKAGVRDGNDLTNGCRAFHDCASKNEKDGERGANVFKGCTI